MHLPDALLSSFIPHSKCGHHGCISPCLLGYNKRKANIRITFPVTAHDHTSDHASVQVKKLISVLAGEKGRSELQELLSIKNRDYFRTDYLVPAINKGYIEPTIPDKPNSQNQKYRLTAKGLALKEKLKHYE